MMVRKSEEPYFLCVTYAVRCGFLVFSLVFFLVVFFPLLTAASTPGCGTEKELNTTLMRENQNFPEVLESD